MAGKANPCGKTRPVDKPYKVSAEIKHAIRNKYAWPGGYPLFLVMSDGGALCLDCGKKEFRQIAYAHRHNLRDGWRVAAPDINWEETDLRCDHCNNKIESAYGEDKAMDHKPQLSDAEKSAINALDPALTPLCVSFIGMQETPWGTFGLYNIEETLDDNLSLHSTFSLQSLAVYGYRPVTV